MMLCYVDNIICTSNNPTATMKEVVQSKCKIKDDKIEVPDIYLGAQLMEKVINGQTCWTMSSDKFVNGAVKNVEARLEKMKRALPKNAMQPFRSGYRPELDVSDELEAS